jgi:hypothetical protein
MPNDRPPKPRTHSLREWARLPAALEPLTEQDRWVNWSWELRSGKWTKPPRQPRDLGFAQSNNPDTWASYERALRRVQDRDADGIGYMLLGAGIAAADLDRCCKRDADTRTTKIDPWARALRNEANGAYCEVTVSGTGLRLIGTASEQEMHRRFKIGSAQPDAEIELFRNTARFITVSGLVLKPLVPTLSPLDAFIDAVFERYAARATTAASALNAQNTQTQHRGPTRDWDAIIREGEPPGENRSNVFQSVVWHLLGCGHAVDEIERMLAAHPTGIANRFIAENRLRREVERSYEKWQLVNPRRAQGLPVIRVIDGEIARMVDEAQDALHASGLPIFTGRGGLVQPITVEREAAHGRNTKSTVLASIDESKIVYLLNKNTAVFQKFDGRQGIWRAINPPGQVATMLLSLKQWKFPEVIGVVGAPTMRPDGSVLTVHSISTAAGQRPHADGVASGSAISARVRRLAHRLGSTEWKGE